MTDQQIPQEEMVFLERLNQAVLESQADLLDAMAMLEFEAGSYRLCLELISAMDDPAPMRNLARAALRVSTERT